MSSCRDPGTTPVMGAALASVVAPVPISPMTPLAAAIDLGVAPLAIDERGVPRLLRGTGPVPASAIPGSPAPGATAAARRHVERLAPAWGVRTGAVPMLEGLGEVAVPGGTIVRLRQVIDGLPVDGASGGELHVMVGEGGALLAASGTLVAADTPHDRSAGFVDDDAGAVARAVHALYGTSVAPAALASTSRAADGARFFAGRAGQIDVSLARARQAWYPDGKALTAAWIVEAYSSNLNTTDGDAYRTVISADGRVLARTDLRADLAFDYRVFAETTGGLHPFDGPIADSTPNATGIPRTTPYPAYVTPHLVTASGLNHPAGAAQPDPWLASGSTATIGNNVEAYSDSYPPDGLTAGDFHATVTAPGVFDRTYDTSRAALSSQGQQMAAITSLFYTVNWLHDFWYDAGFTETAGNAQTSNLSRGGEDHDAILAEAQDNATIGAHDNANIATPADGMPPRLQMYTWTGAASSRSLTLDGALDATMVAHEFGHYLHDRLCVCHTQLCRATTEGWADFTALLLMARAGDHLDGAFPLAIYSTRSYLADPVYYGIRRAPYSTTQAINGLSFRHMANGEPLPPPPFNAGSTSLNSDVHNAGEVWASMLWDGYVALQKAGTSFEDVQNRMRQYVVAGLLLAVPDATPTEARDALLIAVQTVSPSDHDILAAAYAGRGFGSCAVSPARDSTTFTGIIEGHDIRGQIAPGAVALQSTTSCDTNNLLDAGEAARLVVPLANLGPAALSAVTVTLTSTTPGVHLTNAMATVGTLAAYTRTTATFDVRLDATVTTPVAGEFAMQIATPDGCDATTTVPLALPLNAVDQPASSATDTFDALGSVWTPTGSTTVWSHNRKTALDGVWVGSDAPVASDASLASPPLQAGADPVSVTFTHRFSFELVPAKNTTPALALDGGVIESSIDGGATWQDVSTISTPGYNHVLFLGTNPLGVRPAYGGTNASYPATDQVTLDFGTHFANTTFQLRFRVGSDSGVGAPGWEINDVAFTGIAGTPFPTLAAHPGFCNAGPDGAFELAGGGCGCRQTGGSGLGSAGVALGLLAMLRRRRRRSSSEARPARSPGGPLDAGDVPGLPGITG